MRYDSLPARIVRLPLRLIPKNLDVPVCLGLNRGYRWRVGSAIHSCWLGNYERKVQQQLPRWLRPNMTCFDVGANAGFYTLALSRLVGPGGRVVAFEPLPENAAIVRHHLALNRIRQATVLECALDHRDGRHGFAANDSPAMGRLRDGAPLLVSTVRLDTLVSTGRVPAPDFVKMDIEGGELAALQGAEATLRQAKPTLLVAFHSEDLFRDCVALLGEIGYALRDLDDRKLDPNQPPASEALAVHPERASFA